MDKDLTRRIADKHFKSDRCVCRVHWYKNPRKVNWNKVYKTGYATCPDFVPPDEAWMASEQNELIYCEWDGEPEKSNIIGWIIVILNSDIRVVIYNKKRHLPVVMDFAQEMEKMYGTVIGVIQNDSAPLWNVKKGKSYLCWRN